MLQTIETSKLCISETLWLHLLLVLNDADIYALTTSEEIGDISNCGVEGKVSEMDCIRWLVGQWKFLANGVSCVMKALAAQSIRKKEIKRTTRVTSSIGVCGRVIGSALATSVSSSSRICGRVVFLDIENRALEVDALHLKVGRQIKKVQDSALRGIALTISSAQLPPVSATS